MNESILKNCIAPYVNEDHFRRGQGEFKTKGATSIVRSNLSQKPMAVMDKSCRGIVIRAPCLNGFINSPVYNFL